MANSTEDRRFFASMVAGPVLILLLFQSPFQTQLGLVLPSSAKQAVAAGGTAAAAAEGAATGDGGIDAEADTELDAPAEDDAQEAATAVVPHPALPSGQLPQDSRFTDMVKDMIAAFFRTMDSANDVSLWDQKVDTPNLKIFMKKSEIPTFKVWSIAENTPLTCFEFVSDATKRKMYDDMTDEVRVIETVDRDTRIVYVRAKGIWPTAGMAGFGASVGWDMPATARDLLLLSHKTVLPDGKLLNVTRSIAHPNCPVRTDGVIRMQVDIAGMLCSASTIKPGACEIFQIGGGDPGGSIPKALINFVSTKAIPIGTEKLNNVLRGLPPIDPPGRSMSLGGQKKRRGGRGKAPTAEAVQQINQVATLVENLERRVASEVAALDAEERVAASILEQVRIILEWASPFMVAAIYVVGIYSLVRGRGQAAA